MHIFAGVQILVILAPVMQFCNGQFNDRPTPGPTFLSSCSGKSNPTVSCASGDINESWTSAQIASGASSASTYSNQNLKCAKATWLAKNGNSAQIAVYGTVPAGAYIICAIVYAPGYSCKCD